MKALFAAFAVAAVVGFAAALPASAKTPDKCLAIDSHGRVINLCTCAYDVRVDPSIKRMLMPAPVRYYLACPIGGGALGPQISEKTPDGRGKSFSKGESSSSILGVAAGGYSPFALTIEKQNNDSVVKGDGAAQAGASASGVAIAGSGGSESFGGTGGVTWGSTGGGSCAGDAC